MSYHAQALLGAVLCILINGFGIWALLKWRLYRIKRAERQFVKDMEERRCSND